MLAVLVLALVIGSVFARGIGAINLDFLTKGPAPFGESGGGISNAIVGTALMVALATAIAVPVGLLVAIYTSEFANRRVAGAVRFVLDVLNGVPTIVTGIFVYGLIVIPQGHQSGTAGAVALAVIMLPIVARTAQEVLALVPGTLKEAAYALGISHWRTVVRVVIPTAAGGLLTGALLAVARVAGETAPLLLVSSIVSPNALHRLLAGARLDPPDDLPALRVPQSGQPHPGLGGRLPPDHVRAPAQRRRARLLRARPQADRRLRK